VSLQEAALPRGERGRAYLPAVRTSAATHVARAALPRMLEAGTGTMINISSAAAHRPLEGWSAYCSAKAGLAMLTDAIALEWTDAAFGSSVWRPVLSIPTCRPLFGLQGSTGLAKSVRSIWRRWDILPPQFSISALLLLTILSARGWR
jgi:hypothetical protein